MTRTITDEQHDEAGDTQRTHGALRNAAFAGASVAAAVAAGTAATAPGGAWYKGLDKPAWQPPQAAFPIVWTSLYADIAVTSALVLNEFERRGEVKQAADYRHALSVNLTLNSAWSWVFFRWHNLPAATVGAGVLAASSWRLARLAGRARPAYGRLLAPYAGWTSFATVLAGTVWRKNPDLDWSH